MRGLLQEQSMADDARKADSVLQAAAEKGEHVFDDRAGGIFDADGRVREQELYDAVFANAGRLAC